MLLPSFKSLSSLPKRLDTFLYSAFFFFQQKTKIGFFNLIHLNRRQSFWRHGTMSFFFLASSKKLGRRNYFKVEPIFIFHILYFLLLPLSLFLKNVISNLISMSSIYYLESIPKKKACVNTDCVLLLFAFIILLSLTKENTNVYHGWNIGIISFLLIFIL